MVGHDRPAGGRVVSRIVWPVALVALAAALGLMVWLVFEEKLSLRNGLERELASVSTLLRTAVDGNVEALELASDEIAANPAVLAFFAAGDFDGLAKGQATHFAHLKQQHSITQYYFIDRDGFARLRLHQPGRRGDRIERLTLKNARAAKRPAFGLELGPLGNFSLRFVRPVFQYGVLLGYIELGREIDRIVAELEGVLDVGVHIVVRRERLASGTGTSDHGKETSKPPTPLSGHVYIVDQGRPLPDWLGPPEIADAVAARDSRVLLPPLAGNSSTAVGILPLYDAANRLVGHILVTFNIGPQTAEMWLKLGGVGGSLLAFLLLFIAMAWRLGVRLDREIAGRERTRLSAQADLEDCVDQRTRELQREVAERARSEEALRLSEKKPGNVQPCPGGSGAHAYQRWQGAGGQRPLGRDLRLQKPRAFVGRS